MGNTRSTDFNPTTQGQYKLHITVDGDGIGIVLLLRIIIHSLVQRTLHQLHDGYPGFIDISPNNLWYITHDDGFVTVYNSKAGGKGDAIKSVR